MNGGLKAILFLLVCLTLAGCRSTGTSPHVSKFGEHINVDFHLHIHCGDEKPKH